MLDKEAMQDLIDKYEAESVTIIVSANERTTLASKCGNKSEEEYEKILNQRLNHIGCFLKFIDETASMLGVSRNKLLKEIEEIEVKHVRENGEA